MLIMQLQLYQLTCKLPIWTQRERDTERYMETDRNRGRHREIYGEADKGRQ